MADLVRVAGVDDAFSFKRDDVVALTAGRGVVADDVSTSGGSEGVLLAAVKFEELLETPFEGCVRVSARIVFKRFDGGQLSANDCSALLSTLLLFFAF